MGRGTRACPRGWTPSWNRGAAGCRPERRSCWPLRASFCRIPGLVILDEASSRLDPATENLIERAVDTLVKDRTAIVIAHRLGTVQRADEILILEEGRVGEYGARAALARDPQSRFYSLLQTGLMEEVLA